MPSLSFLISIHFDSSIRTNNFHFHFICIANTQIRFRCSIHSFTWLMCHVQSICMNLSLNSYPSPSFVLCFPNVPRKMRNRSYCVPSVVNPFLIGKYRNGDCTWTNFHSLAHEQWLYGLWTLAEYPISLCGKKVTIENIYITGHIAQ